MGSTLHLSVTLSMVTMTWNIPTLDPLRDGGENYSSAFIVGGSELEDETQDVEW
jgi:hypothetical protein